MLVVPNHHVIVPKTQDLTYQLPWSITAPGTERRAHIQRAFVSNVTQFQLNFQPLSDQWVEVYLENFRLLNYKYVIQETRAYPYETYNLDGNVIVFTSNVSGNLKVISDTLAWSPCEDRLESGFSGIPMEFENIHSYDLFEKRFVPSRFSNNPLNLEPTVIRVRVGDAHYAEPVVLSQPCYGYVRVSKNRMGLVYVPRKNFKGWDVFSYTLLSQHGQPGKPACITVNVNGDELRYNWSAEFDGYRDSLVFASDKALLMTAIGNRKTTIEFFYFTANVMPTMNYTVGVFGQYNTSPKNNRYAVFLQGTSESSDQVVVLKYNISGLDLSGNIVYADNRVSSRQRLPQKQWHHVAIQIDGTTPSRGNVFMYINGLREEFYNQDFTSQTGYTTDDFYLGEVNSNIANVYQGFNGYISNFRFVSNSHVYTAPIIKPPQRPLTVVANTAVLSLNTIHQSTTSIHDQGPDPNLIAKFGNVRMRELGPFSPVLFTKDRHQVRNGDTVTVDIAADYICSGTLVPWSIRGNVYPITAQSVTLANTVVGLQLYQVTSGGEIQSINNLGIAALEGNFRIDEVDQLMLTISTTNPVLTSRQSFDIVLDQWPLVYTTVDVFAEPNGLVLELDTANSRSAFGYIRDNINYNHGYMTSTVTYNPANGGHYILNGVSDVITGNNTVMIDTLADITCETWFAISAAVSDEVRIFGRGNLSARSYGLSYFTANNHFIYERVNEDGNLRVIYANVSSIIGGWHHLVGTTQGHEHKLYYNGQLVASDNQDMQPFLTCQDGYTVGKAAWGGYHNGAFAVARLYNRALSAGEIAAKFAADRTKYGR